MADHINGIICVQIQIGTISLLGQNLSPFHASTLCSPGRNRLTNHFSSVSCTKELGMQDGVKFGLFVVPSS